MQIGSILTVGIDNTQFTGTLERLGYTVRCVDGIVHALEFNEPFDLMVLNESLPGGFSGSDLERIYFSNNRTPVAVLAENAASLSSDLLSLVIRGSFDLLYTAEIESGAVYPRIDKLLLTSKLNRALDAMQHDVHSREALQKEITLREQILHHERVVNANIIGSITSGLVILDLDGVVILANEHSRPLFRNAAAETVGRPFRSCLITPVGDMVAAFFDAIHAPKAAVPARKFTIRSLFYTVYCYRMLDYHNTPSGILMLVNDITEQEHLNASLYRSEKLATIGTMLSGIAHELRNPLAIISARAQRALSKKEPPGEWERKCFVSIEEQTKRCASIVNNLLNFARNTATTAGFHKISDVIEETLSYISYQNVFDDIAVIKKYPDSLLVYGDRSRFVQVFLNLITNAADAMEGRGTLTITAQNKGACILTGINDTGPGIDDATKKRIFDPFFTTKDPGKGTGLGLAIVCKIVEESNGKLWCVSRPGSTSFFVELPSHKERSHDAAYPGC